MAFLYVQIAAMMVMTALLLMAATAKAADAPAASTAPAAGKMSCPPQFLTDPERRQYAINNTIRTGPWHAKCFQNGMPIYDRDHLYLSCLKGDATALMESADGHPIDFQFPPEIACTWER